MKYSDRFTLTSAFFEKPKIRLLSSFENGDEKIMILLRLLFIADSSDDGGNLTVANGVYYTPEMLGAVLSKPLDTIKSALDIFEKFGITERVNGVIRILDYFDSSNINEADIIREQTRKRVAKHRQKNRSVTQCNGECNADVTLHVTQEEKENEKEESSLKKKSTPHTPRKEKVTLKEEKAKEKECQDSSEELFAVSKAKQRVIDAWNGAGLTEIKGVRTGSDRYKMLNARLREYGEEQILEAIEKAKSSPFLKGQNSKGWVITFDWFLKPNNFIKVLEGNYCERETQHKPFKSPAYYPDRKPSYDIEAFKRGLTSSGKI